VGNTTNYFWAGYEVQLLAGGTPQPTGDGSGYAGAVTGGVVLARDANTQTIAVDTFATSTVTYYCRMTERRELLGQPLQIRLLALAASEEVDFDDVRLNKVFRPPTGALLTVR
jgi:hypothetical protein